MYTGLIGCDQEGGFKDVKGRGGANIMQDGTVDLQHETEQAGNRTHASMATTSSKGFGI
jgi:hypothetical protein